MDGGGMRAGAHAYLGPRLGLATDVGDMMVMESRRGHGRCDAQSWEAAHLLLVAAASVLERSRCIGEQRARAHAVNQWGFQTGASACSPRSLRVW
jgi:hypothetical protein